MAPAGSDSVMPDLSPASLATVALVFLLAGLVKGVTGMGLPTVAMALLGSLMSPAAAAALLLVPSLATNLWQLLAGPDLALLLRRLRSMMLGILPGTLVGSWLLTRGEGAWATTALGIALAAYAALALLLRPPPVAARLERLLSLPMGLATGLVTGATGVFVLPAVPYLQALGLERDRLVQALGLSFTVSTVALALGLAGGGALRGTDLGLSALALLPALLGMWIGQGLRRLVSPAAFRRWFLVALLLLGLQLVLR